MKTTCGMFLFDKRGRMLICHPTNADAGVWSIPKGLHEAGESYLESAMRELHEEANINLLVLTDRIKGVYELPRVPYANRLKALQPFVVVTDANFDRHDIKCTSIARAINLPECDDHRWVSLREATDLLHESQARCLTKVKDTLQKHRTYAKETDPVR